MTTAALARISPVPIVGVLPPTTEVDQKESQWLVASPYLEHSHLLDLGTLETQARLFALALSHLQLATPDYAVIRFEDVFDFTALMAILKSLANQDGFFWKHQDFYVVEFRSQLKHEYDGDRLAFLDKESHKEAVASGGLLKYWFGVPDTDQKNLATCFWRSKEDAIKGGRGPQHRIARGIIMTTYEHIDIRGLRLTIDDEVSGWRFEPYV